MSRKVPSHLKKNQRSTSMVRLVLFFLGGFSLLLSIIFFFLFLAIWTPAKKFISDKPLQIDHIVVSQKQEDAVSQKLNNFFRQPTALDTLSFSEEEFNHLVNASPLVKEYKVRYRIKLLDSTFNLKCVAPLSSVRNQMVSIIRYLNVKGFLNAELEGIFKVKGQKVMMIAIYSQMNGYPAPFALLGDRTNIDILKYFPNRFVYDKMRKSLKQIYIRDGNIFIVRQ